MNTMTMSIPHQVTRAEAKQRIEGQLGQLRNQSGGLITQFVERWHGDDMDFTATAIGTSITGRLFVEDRQVRVEVDLPWLLAALAGSLRHAIEHQTRQLLQHRQPV